MSFEEFATIMLIETGNPHNLLLEVLNKNSTKKLLDMRDLKDMKIIIIVIIKVIMIVSVIY